MKMSRQAAPSRTQQRRQTFQGREKHAEVSATGHAKETAQEGAQAVGAGHKIAKGARSADALQEGAQVLRAVAARGETADSPLQETKTHSAVAAGNAAARIVRDADDLQQKIAQAKETRVPGDEAAGGAKAACDRFGEQLPVDRFLDMTLDQMINFLQLDNIENEELDPSLVSFLKQNLNDDKRKEALNTEMAINNLFLNMNYVATKLEAETKKKVALQARKDVVTAKKQLAKAKNLIETTKRAVAAVANGETEKAKYVAKMALEFENALQLEEHAKENVKKIKRIEAEIKIDAAEAKTNADAAKKAMEESKILMDKVLHTKDN